MDAWGKIVQQDSNAFFVEQRRQRVESMDRAKSYRKDLEKQVIAKKTLSNQNTDRHNNSYDQDIGTQLRDQELKVEEKRK